jgi:hypothetical protein
MTQTVKFFQSQKLFLMRKNIFFFVVISIVIITSTTSFGVKEFQNTSNSLKKAAPSWWYGTNQTTNAILRRVILNDPPCYYNQLVNILPGESKFITTFCDFLVQEVSAGISGNFDQVSIQDGFGNVLAWQPSQGDDYRIYTFYNVSSPNSFYIVVE